MLTSSQYPLRSLCAACLFLKKNHNFPYKTEYENLPGHYCFCSDLLLSDNRTGSGFGKIQIASAI